MVSKGEKPVPTTRRSARIKERVENGVGGSDPDREGRSKRTTRKLCGSSNSGAETGVAEVVACRRSARLRTRSSLNEQHNVDTAERGAEVQGQENKVDNGKPPQCIPKPSANCPSRRRHAPEQAQGEVDSDPQKGNDPVKNAEESSHAHTRKRARSPVELSSNNGQAVARIDVSPQGPRRKRPSKAQVPEGTLVVLLSDSEADEVHCSLRPGGSFLTAIGILESPCTLTKMTGSSVKRTRPAGKENESAEGGRERVQWRRSVGEALQARDLNEAISFGVGERELGVEKSWTECPKGSPAVEHQMADLAVKQRPPASVSTVQMPDPIADADEVQSQHKTEVAPQVDAAERDSTAVMAVEKSENTLSVFGRQGRGHGVMCSLASVAMEQLHGEFPKVDPPIRNGRENIEQVVGGVRASGIVPPFPLPGSSPAMSAPLAIPQPFRRPVASSCSVASKDTARDDVQKSVRPPFPLIDCNMGLQQATMEFTATTGTIPQRPEPARASTAARTLWGLDAASLKPSLLPAPSSNARPRCETNKHVPATGLPRTVFPNQMPVGAIGGIFQMFFPPAVTSPTGKTTNGNFPAPPSPTASSSVRPPFHHNEPGSRKGLLNLPPSYAHPLLGNAMGGSPQRRRPSMWDCPPVSPTHRPVALRRDDRVAGDSPQKSPARHRAPGSPMSSAFHVTSQRASSPALPVSRSRRLVTIHRDDYVGGHSPRKSPGGHSQRTSPARHRSPGSPMSTAFRATSQRASSPALSVSPSRRPVTIHRDERVANHSPRKSPARHRAPGSPISSALPATSQRPLSPGLSSARHLDNAVAVSGREGPHGILGPYPSRGLSQQQQPSRREAAHFIFDTSALHGCFEYEGRRHDVGFRALFEKSLRDDVRVVIPCATRIQLDVHKCQRGGDGGGAGGGGGQARSTGLARKAYLARQASRMLENLLHPDTRPTLVFEDRKEFEDAWVRAKRGGCGGVDPYDACIVSCAVAHRLGGAQRVVVVSGDRNMRIESRTQVQEEPHILAVSPYELYEWLARTPAADVDMLWKFITSVSHQPVSMAVSYQHSRSYR